MERKVSRVVVQLLALSFLLSRWVDKQVVRSIGLSGNLLCVKPTERCHMLAQERPSLRVEGLVQIVLNHYVVLLSRLLLPLSDVAFKLTQVLSHLRDLLLVVRNGVLEHVWWHARIVLRKLLPIQLAA